MHVGNNVAHEHSDPQGSSGRCSGRMCHVRVDVSNNHSINQSNFYSANIPVEARLICQVELATIIGV